MEQISVTAELLARFNSNPQSLILAGYAQNFDSALLYRNGDDFAVVVPTGQDSADVPLLCQDFSFVGQLMEQVGCKEYKFCGVTRPLADYLQAHYPVTMLTRCGLFVYDGNPLPPSGNADLRPLPASYAQSVSDGTFYHADVEQIARCLSMHPSVAAFEEGNPVCWCLLHEEGSLGMLYTLPQYRRKGYALQVMVELCKRVLARGNTPFAYIVEDNVASQSLAPKYNLQRVGNGDYVTVVLQ